MIHNGFTWRKGFPTKADANAFAAQLDTLKSVDGTVNAEDVLDAQRAESAPLHQDIVWDDLAAAHMYRLGYVADAMGALQVIPVDLVKEEAMAPIRALMPTLRLDRDTGEPRVYQFVVSVGGQPNVAELRVREQALGDVRRLAGKLAKLPGCGDIAERLIELANLL